MSTRRVVVVALVALLVLPGSALAVPKGEPSISVYAPDNSVAPGETVDLTLKVANDGQVDVGGSSASQNDIVTTASGVSVTLDEDDAPMTVHTGTTPLGTLKSGAVSPATFSVTVPEDADPDTYTAAAKVSYKYTRQILSGSGDYDNQQKTKTIQVPIEVSEEPRFEIVDTENTIAIGEDGTVTLDVRNVGNERARDATVTVESLSADVTFGQSQSATQFAGRWNAGETKTLVFNSSATADAAVTDYPLETTVSYESVDDFEDASDSMTTSIRPQGEQTIDLTTSASDLAVGTKGSVTVTVANQGPKPLHDATISLRPIGETVTPVEPEQVLGTLDVDEQTTVEYPVRVASGVDPGPRQLTYTIDYYNAQNEPRQSDPLTVRTAVDQEQTFTLTDVESTLRVGDEGDVTGTLTNDGPSDAENVVVTLQPTGQTLKPQETEYAVGSLASGESAAISFPIDVTESAGAGPRQLSVVTTYDDADGDAQKTDPINTRVSVSESRDVFSVAPEDATIKAGSSESVTLRVTNNGEQTLTNVNAKAYVDDPLSAETDEAYFERLAPGNSTTIAFDLSASGKAPSRTHPLEIDFQYDEPDGDTKLTDTYQVPVTVTAKSGGSGTPAGFIGVGALAFVGAGAFIYKRR
jgi:hypothetical protein